jgi:hypothetical protein
MCIKAFVMLVMIMMMLVSCKEVRVRIKNKLLETITVKRYNYNTNNDVVKAHDTDPETRISVRPLKLATLIIPWVNHGEGMKVINASETLLFACHHYRRSNWFCNSHTKDLVHYIELFKTNRSYDEMLLLVDYRIPRYNPFGTA